MTWEYRRRIVKIINGIEIDVTGLCEIKEGDLFKMYNNGDSLDNDWAIGKVLIARSSPMPSKEFDGLYDIIGEEYKEV